jgi:hypothetical protein
MRGNAFWPVLGVGLLWSASAFAQQSAAPAPRTVAPAPLAPAEPAPKGGRPSSGFFGIGLGLGYFHANSGSSPDRRVFSGGSISGQLVAGGRIGKWRRVTVGAAYLRDQVFGLSSTDQSVDGDEPDLHDTKFALSALGFFADVALDSHPALHFQGLIGLGSLVVSRPSNRIDNPSGAVFDLGVGYDFFTGGGVALGALLRANYAPFDVDEAQGTSVHVLTPSLLFTVAAR